MSTVVGVIWQLELSVLATKSRARSNLLTCRTLSNLTICL